MKSINTIPKAPDSWLKEIALAYLDAREALPFGRSVGENLTEADLFHMAPLVCLKFRGIKDSKPNLKRATDAALASYIATSNLAGNLFDEPQMAFAFCYLASHFGLGLITEEESSKAIDFIERNLKTLIEITKKGRVK